MTLTRAVMLVAMGVGLVMGTAAGAADTRASFSDAREKLLTGKDSAYARLREGDALLKTGASQEGHARRILSDIPPLAQKAAEAVKPFLEDSDLPIRSIALWFAGYAGKLELLSRLRVIRSDGSVEGRPALDVGADLDAIIARYRAALVAMETPESDRYFAKDADHERGRKEYADMIRKDLGALADAKKQLGSGSNEWQKDGKMTEKGEREMMEMLGTKTEDGKKPGMQLIPVPQGDPQRGFSEGVPQGLH